MIILRVTSWSLVYLGSFDRSFFLTWCRFLPSRQIKCGKVWSTCQYIIHWSAHEFREVKWRTLHDSSHHYRRCREDCRDGSRHEWTSRLPFSSLRFWIEPSSTKAKSTWNSEISSKNSGKWLDIRIRKERNGRNGPMFRKVRKLRSRGRKHDFPLFFYDFYRCMFSADLHYWKLNIWWNICRENDKNG